MGSLKIFKASAGSGKTFTLTVEYIKLLIINQTDYRHTLAVTFTNKATAEMKQRILSTLYGVQHSLADSQNYYEKIANSPEIVKLHIDEAELRRRAGVALHNLLHDYARFRIETIDSFFLSVVRDISREMNLTANLNIVLDTEDVLSEAVDDIVDQLRVGNSASRKILRFVDDRIDEYGKWKITDEVKEFGKNIFNEKFLEQGYLIADSLEDEKFVHNYRRNLYSVLEKVEKSLHAEVGTFMRVCSENDWDEEDFVQKGRGIYGFFDKLSTRDELPPVNSYVQKCIDNPSAWFAKNKGNVTVAEETFVPLLNKVLRIYDQCRKVRNSVISIAMNLNHLLILGEIDRRVQGLNADANRFLLASTAHLLNRMIDKNSVPFIYEKSGTIFRHIMIDEFQDTSALQWRNFLPLLMNSLDSSEMCLIVGDVKQSIYRWRNSDWQILNGINDDPMFKSLIQPQAPLNVNRRSLGNIIDFNNEFFTLAVRALNDDYREAHDGRDSESLVRAYSDVCQQMDDKNRGRGYVKVECLKGQGGEEKLNYTERTYSRLVELVHDLVGKGVRPNDICILTRRNKHVPAITQAFADAGSSIKVVSNEAYQLRSSLVISFLVSVMRYLVNPDSRVCLFTLVHEYLTSVKGTRLTEEELFGYMVADKETLLALLPSDFTTSVDRLVFEPLLELVERIFDIFELRNIKNQDGYLFFFHDCLLDFTNNNVPDIDVFLRYWDDVLSVKTIPGDSSDGVSIMSIHKSKGLEFQTVIVPFCDWEMTGKSSELLWCTPQEEPYDQMKLVAVNYRKELADSVFAGEYDDEILRYTVDNLNLLYVAFTRPKSNLIVLTCEDARKNQDGISRINHLLAKSLPGSMTAAEVEGVGDVWTFGEIVPSDRENKDEKKAEDKGEENVLMVKPDTVPVTFYTQKNLPEFRQSNESTMFVQNLREQVEPQAGDEPEDVDTVNVTPVGRTEREGQRSYVDRGLLYHYVYQQIIYADDAPLIIEKMMMKGLFRSVDERQEVETEVMKSLADPDTGRWFTRDWRVINERAILYRDENGKVKECRPDRVIVSGKVAWVIDYKTGRYNEEHRKQVRTYMEHLHNMGYEEVHGCVWYLMRGKVYNEKTIRN